MSATAQADGDARDFNAPTATDDERLAELAFQSERLSGKFEPKRSVELLEDDVRYLIQENSDLEHELERWQKWYEDAPEYQDSSSRWAAWHEGAPTRDK